MKAVEAEKAKLMEMEIERIGRELESNQKSLTAATLKLIQNSERDSQTIERLTEIEKNTDTTAGKQKQIPLFQIINDYRIIRTGTSLKFYLKSTQVVL